MVIKFWLSFLPIFMAVNAIGLLPMFISFTINLEKSQINRIIIQSVITGTIVSLFFLAVGSMILNVLGITVADYHDRGRSLLFVISLDDLSQRGEGGPADQTLKAWVQFPWVSL